MSGSPSKPAKTMSSRLLTMKFMQRAAASAVDEPETPSPKRQRLSASSRPETLTSDLDAVNAALAAEEQKRAEAVARQAAEAGETNWVLDFSAANPAASPMSVSASTYYPSQPMIVAADSLDAENQAMAYGGRRSYGNFQRKSRHPNVVHVNEDGTPVDASDQQSSVAMTEKQKKRAERRAREMAREPRLDKLTSISGGRSSTIDVRGHGHGKKKHGKHSGKKRSK